jgi:sugar phosphate isomerase/epimerase
MVGQACLASGYSAVDLTVRTDGHVQPTLVKTNLPLMLNGIRSTGCLCTQIGANFAPPTDSTNTAWLTTQFVDDILSTAAANGIQRYRFNNAGGASYTANTYGTAMTAQLDGMRINLRRLAQVSAKYGVMCGVAETHEAFNIGTSVWDYNYAMQGIDPNAIGINVAIGHVAAQAPNTVWQLAMRYAMPYIKSTALQDIKATVNATTGALSFSTVQAGTGGVINWVTFFQNLLRGGYNGAGEAQIEYSIVGANGTTVSLNSAFFADNAQFTSGNLTPAIMIASMTQEVTYYKAQATAAGWTAAQMT